MTATSTEATASMGDTVLSLGLHPSAPCPPSARSPRLPRRARTAPAHRITPHTASSLWGAYLGRWLRELRLRRRRTELPGLQLSVGVCHGSTATSIHLTGDLRRWAPRTLARRVPSTPKQCRISDRDVGPLRGSAGPPTIVICDSDA